MSISLSSSLLNLDLSLKIFTSLSRTGLHPSLSCYNAALDACARATALWNTSSPLADMCINAAASLSASGVPLFALHAGSSRGAFGRESCENSSFENMKKLKPFTRAKWTEAIRLIVACVHGVTCVRVKQHEILEMCTHVPFYIVCDA